MIGKLALSLDAAAPAKQASLNSYFLMLTLEADYSHKCVLDDFPEELETGEITKALCSVGFASPMLYSNLSRQTDRVHSCRSYPYEI